MGDRSIPSVGSIIIAAGNRNEIKVPHYTIVPPSGLALI